MLLQIAMVLWKHVGDLDQAEEYFRRIRKAEATHPAALEFYRSYYTAKGETGKLMTMLKQVQGGSGPASAELAELAEAQNNPEKAIEAWKQHLRTDPTSAQARAALQRLYRKTEKWNALLDLMKDEVDRLGDGDVAGKVARLFEVAEIYRDRLKLDVMVINTYNAILKLDPENQRAGDELAAKFRALGRWNDLIAVLTRKSEAPNVPDEDRVKLLREVADLWTERFGNFANAIKPLEKLAEIAPSDIDAIARLKEIYTKRRQWRQLIDLLGKEARVARRATTVARSRARWRGSPPSGSATRGSRSRSTTASSARHRRPTPATRSRCSPTSTTARSATSRSPRSCIARSPRCAVDSRSRPRRRSRSSRSSARSMPSA